MIFVLGWLTLLTNSGMWEPRPCRDHTLGCMQVIVSDGNPGRIEADEVLTKGMKVDNDELDPAALSSESNSATFDTSLTILYRRSKVAEEWQQGSSNGALCLLALRWLARWPMPFSLSRVAIVFWPPVQHAIPKRSNCPQRASHQPALSPTCFAAARTPDHWRKLGAKSAKVRDTSTKHESNTVC